MELRKVQMTKSGTFFVTLPKEWAQNYGLTRGSIVASLITPDGKLIIDPKYGVEHAPRTITIRPGPYLSREIIGKYLLGYDIICVESKDRITPDQRDTIKRASAQLIGLEIIEEDYNKIVMQCLLEPSALSPEKILRREHLIASGMCKDAITALLEGDKHLARNVVARDNEVDRLYFLLVRILRTIIQNPSLGEKMKIHPVYCLDYRLTASLIESVADQSSQIAEYAMRFKGSEFTDESLKAVYDLHKAVHEAYNDAVIAFLSHNVSIAESVRERKQSIEDLSRRVESLASTLSIDRAQDLITVVSLLGRIYDHSVDISDLTTPEML
ncbi:MAG: PhoU domain-containing protein [Candidatus Bathyarchaeia archaeon]|nr:hypothetical protein [Candidatus Bathyarchaeota archaeon]